MHYELFRIMHNFNDSSNERNHNSFAFGYLFKIFDMNENHFDFIAKKDLKEKSFTWTS